MQFSDAAVVCLRRVGQALMPLASMMNFAQSASGRAAGFGAMALLAAVAWGGSAAHAQLGVGAAEQGANVIPASNPDALPQPSEWRCTRIAPEYRSFLAAGNDPQQWRFAGRTFRTSDAEPVTYQWSDWLRWFEASCDAAAAPDLANVAEGPPSLPLVIGGVVAGVGIIGLIGSGSPSDSPG